MESNYKEYKKPITVKWINQGNMYGEGVALGCRETPIENSDKIRIDFLVQPYSEYEFNEPFFISQRWILPD